MSMTVMPSLLTTAEMRLVYAQKVMEERRSGLTSIPAADVSGKNCLVERHATGVEFFASVEVGRPCGSKKRRGVGTRDVWDKRTQVTMLAVFPIDSLKFGANYGSVVGVGEKGDETMGGG